MSKEQSSVYQEVCGLQVDTQFRRFIEQEALPGTGVTATAFWGGLSRLIQEYAPRNEALLQTREDLQAQIDAWHRQHPGPIQAEGTLASYRHFLESIGYLAPDPGEVSIRTRHIDTELSTQAGPQLVVPVLNARYALNAVNARWGSLYDALYGTDAIADEGGAQRGSAYNPLRGQKVVSFAKTFLDQNFPLTHGPHAQVQQYRIEQGQLRARLLTGEDTGLARPEACIGFQGDGQSPSAIVLRHHGLHVEIQRHPDSPIAQADPAGVSDVVLESAVSTILDLEDSVAVVDAQDKILAYRNWLEILKGSLTDTFMQKGRPFTRRLAQDRLYTGLHGEAVQLQGRALMFIRNVGHLMTHPAVRWRPQPGQWRDAPEGLLDAMCTVAIAMHDLQSRANSKAGSIYVVKPKMHGPEEVAFACEVFGRVEDALGIPPLTVKLGIMDEERRTSVNLKACIAAAADRLAFINTGFLDRTGDEIHTSMQGGPMIRKADMKGSPWLAAYERHNVLMGLRCGLGGRAQIGKGMWAMPDLMADMLKLKGAHPRAGANTAWVPSPTAATLHALHYHEVDVKAVQRELSQVDADAERASLLDAMLSAPIATQTDWTPEQRQEEVDNNVQGLLGYVVRWIDQGVGCSKVPDIHHVGLMEDRATLRISSQHLGNWLLHGVVTKAQVLASFERMARVVDQQNADDPHYRTLSGRQGESMAYQAALDLVFKACTQPSGYTEPLLHAWRRQVKTQAVHP